MFIFYLFGISAFMFLALYIGASAGFHELADAFVGPGDYGYSIEAAAGTLSFALVAGLIWAFHWRTLNALTPKLSTDARMLPHFYLFGAALTLAFGFYLSGGGTLAGLFGLSNEWTLSDFVGNAMTLVMTSALWLYHLRIFRREYQGGHTKTTLRKSRRVPA
jgi:hypothetical protein